MPQSAGTDASTPFSARARAPESGLYKVGLKRPVSRERASVQEYFDRFAAAMTSGDTKAMLKLWGLPAFVLGKYEARVVQSESEVEQFFNVAKDMYNQRGITRTSADVIGLDWVDSDLVVATVRWPYLDDQDQELGEETASYTLLRGENGSFKTRSVLLRSQAPTPVRAEDGTDGE